MSHASHLPNDVAHGSVKSYVTGFVLSVILTLIPFAVVMTGDLGHGAIIAIIVVTAIAQILVQLVYFLHMNTSSEGSWNLLSFVFTVLIIAIVVVGSLWIMYNLNVNMML